MKQAIKYTIKTITLNINMALLFSIQKKLLITQPKQQMNNDNILEIGKGIYLKPASLKFPYMYREAMEVHWDEQGHYLYSPKPTKWTYLDWYKQIQAAAKEQSGNLLITKETAWVNISKELKLEILQEFNHETK